LTILRRLDGGGSWRLERLLCDSRSSKVIDNKLKFVLVFCLQQAHLRGAYRGAGHRGGGGQLLLVCGFGRPPWTTLQPVGNVFCLGVLRTFRRMTCSTCSAKSNLELERLFCNSRSSKVSLSLEKAAGYLDPNHRLEARKQVGNVLCSVPQVGPCR
jgi:hypothetical protein